MLSNKMKKKISKMASDKLYKLANSTANVNILEYIVSLDEYESLIYIAENKNSTAEILNQVVEKGYLSATVMVSGNNNTPADTLKKFIPLTYLQMKQNRSEKKFKRTCLEFCNYDIFLAQTLFHKAICDNSNVTEELLLDIINETYSTATLDAVVNSKISSEKIINLVNEKRDWLMKSGDRFNKMKKSLKKYVALINNESYEEIYNIAIAEAHKEEPLAQSILSDMYRSGYFVKEDYAQCAYWLKRSADNKYLPAMYMYAMDLINNDGDNNFYEALSYLNIAAANGFDKAIEYLKKIA